MRNNSTNIDIPVYPRMLWNNENQFLIKYSGVHQLFLTDEITWGYPDGGKNSCKLKLKNKFYEKMCKTEKCLIKIYLGWLAVNILRVVKFIFFGVASTKLRKRITHSMASTASYNEMIMTKHRAVPRDMKLIRVCIKICWRPAAGCIQVNWLSPHISLE